MVKTNAERQAAYRKRLQNRASLDALGDRTRVAADRAIAALWSYHERNPNDGSFDGFESIDNFRAYLATAPGKDSALVSWCRDFLQYPEDITEDERKALSSIVAIADAITLAADRPKAMRT